MVQAVIPFKKGGVAFILAFFFGLFLFNGIGHMYIGKVRRGVGILILGWLAYSMIFIFLIFTVGLNITQFYDLYDNQNDISGIDDDIFYDNGINTEYLSPSSLMYLLIFGLFYLIYWILQAADANRLAKKFNKHLEKNGTLLWY